MDREAKRQLLVQLGGIVQRLVRQANRKGERVDLQFLMNATRAASAEVGLRILKEGSVWFGADGTLHISGNWHFDTRGWLS